MSSAPAEYDPRYLAGIVLFNRREFFDCHEVLEDLWNECPNDDRRFYQGILQAAVALYHFGNANLRGAHKLFHSAKKYMEPYPEHHFGLNRTAFWDEMAVCFAEVIREGQDLMRRDLRPNDDLIPTIVLEPPPQQWPDPADYLHDDDHE